MVFFGFFYFVFFLSKAFVVKDKKFSSSLINNTCMFGSYFI
ncbi:hypothetical protein LEP1GSC100_4283 [Leptospira interrogans serovar Bataviae str. UI 08561]|nr:hypothetical protein LEP1GSC100_4283 [Leptospira interrogans serovar Bataviae str. UI 08561]